MMRKKCHHKQDEVNYVISEKGDGVTGATILTRITDGVNAGMVVRWVASRAHNL